MSEYHFTNHKHEPLWHETILKLIQHNHELVYSKVIKFINNVTSDPTHTDVKWCHTEQGESWLDCLLNQSLYFSLKAVLYKSLSKYFVLECSSRNLKLCLLISISARFVRFYWPSTFWCKLETNNCSILQISSVYPLGFKKSAQGRCWDNDCSWSLCWYHFMSKSWTFLAVKFYTHMRRI